ncbi:phosphodiesterase [uncultured Roseovarius sp.]|uniref:phosphodiesterase n=1 Tax=uncultured Roseovarius sp. TaxID=293344 RepID=UPI0025D4B19C|nr:phosphodiesterase [uncultured Roseovarius sp.]
MQKLLIFTDLHLLPKGETLIGLDPGARLAQGLAHATERHPDAARIILTGDLTHNADPAEYAQLRGILDTLSIPVALMVGNHDRRAPMLAEIPQTPTTSQGFVQQVIDLGDHRLILLDTLNEAAADTHSGLLCEARLEWLEERLAEAPDKRCVLFTHHPVFATGFKGMDWIGLKSIPELSALLGRHRNVVQVISGHIHRTIQGTINGIPAAIFKSPCHQMPMALGYQDPRLSVAEPGAYGIVLLTDDGIVIHTEDFTLPDLDSTLYD